MRILPVAVLDACVLVPRPLADTLLRLAEPLGQHQARWTDQILDEVPRTLGRSGKSPEVEEKVERPYGSDRHIALRSS